LGGDRESDPWLTLNREYLVLSILVANTGPAKFRVLADDNRTPILVESNMFAAILQPLPHAWAVTLKEDGVLELGPPRWLTPGFWERYFDGESDAVRAFQEDVRAMMGISHPS
jgi:hypothetical protein